MAIFIIGSTVICEIESRHKTTDALTSPDTSMTISITNPAGIKDVNAQAMTNDSAGKYHYNYATTGKTPGKYLTEFVAVNAGETITTTAYFYLEYN